MCNISTNIAFNPEIPPPVALCCWKHHLNYIVNGIEYFRKIDNNVNVLNSIFNSIGGTLLDMYTGNLLPSEIAEELISHLEMCKAVDVDSFNHWIRAYEKDYRCLSISDGSCWALRVGNYPGRFIHIHPGRNSVHTFRFRSANLKCAIAYRILFGWDETNYSLTMLNQARELAKLPPLGAKIDPVGTLKVLRFLCVKNH
jgi:hypothetical protein